ncbi:unnamed protein product [Eruca vesicaria subsp. sativa]|uniref:Longin domain-containing protein n=1 Tax=Eruca vesicaria subsp. sativa TaxID=29727 RepID=A0ABC8KJQ8_ERUVS|nr:unnamed protein product [Eruca vesicaria subsp. sativa]
MFCHYSKHCYQCVDWLTSSLKASESSRKGLIYSFVAKGTVVLAEHTPYSGNFSTISVQCLQKLSTNSRKYTYSCDGHTFNFLVDNCFGDFKKRYGASIKNDDPHPLVVDDKDDDLFGDRFSIAYNLDSVPVYM